MSLNCNVAGWMSLNSNVAGTVAGWMSLNSNVAGWMSLNSNVAGTVAGWMSLNSNVAGTVAGWMSLKFFFCHIQVHTAQHLDIIKGFFYSPTGAQVNCVKNHFKIYIEIDNKTAPTYFGAVAPS